RAAQAPLLSPGREPQQPYNILVVLDGARLLRRVPGMPQVLSRGPEYGLHAICIGDDEQTLPGECTAVTASARERPDASRLRRRGLDVPGPVLADQVSAAWCERLARALAPVRDVSREDSAAGLPATARLLDLLGMPDPKPDTILAGWTRQGRSTRVPIGIAA